MVLGRIAIHGAIQRIDSSMICMRFANTSKNRDGLVPFALKYYEK
jgi:hypothetical protein